MGVGKLLELIRINKSPYRYKLKSLNRKIRPTDRQPCQKSEPTKFHFEFQIIVDGPPKCSPARRLFRLLFVEILGHKKQKGRGIKNKPIERKRESRNRIGTDHTKKQTRRLLTLTPSNLTSKRHCNKEAKCE